MSNRSRGSWSESDPDRPKRNYQTKKEKEFDYRRADSSYAYTVLKGRNPDGEKVFWIMRRNLMSFGDRINGEHQGNWLGEGMGGPAILYRLPELISATQVPGARVLIPEGEKDVDTAVELGFVATCN